MLLIPDSTVKGLLFEPPNPKAFSYTQPDIFSRADKETSLRRIPVCPFPIAFLPDSLPERSQTATQLLELLSSLRTIPRGTVTPYKFALMLSKVESKMNNPDFHTLQGWQGDFFQIDARQFLLELVLKEATLQFFASLGILEDNNDTFEAAIAQDIIPLYVAGRLERLGQHELSWMETPNVRSERERTWCHEAYDKWIYYLARVLREAFTTTGILDSHNLELLQLNAIMSTYLLVGIPVLTPYLDEICFYLSYSFRRAELGEIDPCTIGLGLSKKFTPRWVRKKVQTNAPSSWIQGQSFEALGAIGMYEILSYIRREALIDISGTWINAGSGVGIAAEKILCSEFGIKFIHIDWNANLSNQYMNSGGLFTFIAEQIVNTDRALSNMLKPIKLVKGIFLIHPSSPEQVLETLHIADSFLSPGGLILALIDHSEISLLNWLGFNIVKLGRRTFAIYTKPDQSIPHSSPLN